MLSTHRISLNQERYLIAEEYTNTNYALTASYRIMGALDTEKLLACFQRVVDSNDALRIQFSKNSNGEITQHLMPSNTIAYDYHTISDPNDAKIRGIISEYFYKKNIIFDAFTTKCQLIKIDETEHILSIACHHSLMDGLSIAVLMMQLAKAWNLNKTTLTSSGNYLDLLIENGLLSISDDKLLALSAFWRNYLSNANPAVLPNDYKLNNANHEDKARAKRLISSAAIEDIDNFAKKYDCSKFHIFYLAYKIVIAKQSGGSDVITSFESHGRQDLKNASRAIGLFSTALALRLRISDESTINQLLIDIKNGFDACIAHQRYPYHYIIKDAKINLKYSFNWFPKYLPPKLEGLEVTQEVFLNFQSSFDFNLHCYSHDDGVSLEPLYNPTLFSNSRVETLLEQIENIAHQIVTNPDQKISDIKLISEDADQYLPDIDLSFSSKINKKIDEAFCNQVIEHPQNIAIHYQNQDWTYQESDQISNRLAQLLLKKGLVAGNKVAIFGLRCPAMIMAILATLRTGASFTVFNAAYPTAMLKKYWDTLNPDFLIACGQDLSLADFNFSKPADARFVQLDHVLNLNDPVLSSITDQSIPSPSINPNTIAYYLFTSGTTNEPKCIATSHSPLVHFVNWQIATFKIVPEDKFTMLSGVSHDPVLRDIFTALSAGATILIPNEETIFNPESLYHWLLDTKPTICHTTPAMIKLMYNGYGNKDQINSLRAVFSGGDRLESHHVKDMITMAPNASIVNFYGASETPQAMAYHQIDAFSFGEAIPIGKPISDTQILVLNQGLRTAGLYEVGQIAVRTKYLSEGYVSAKRTDLSDKNKVYLNDIFSDDPEIKIYLTGDSGYFRADGSAVFLGRNDDEVKIRGYRINLNVINHNIKGIPSVEDAFTFVVEDINSSSDKKRLVAYVQKNSTSSITTNEIRNQLAAQLPSYMLPSHFVFTQDLPLLPNGKIDRKKLISTYIEHDSYSLDKHVGGRNEIENNLIYSWAKILNINPKEVSAKDSFTTLDGDSLSFIQASLVLEREIGKIPEDWQSLSIEKLAEISYQEQNKLDVHTEVLFRAIAIILVVVGHFWIIDANKQVEELFINATSALLLIAGFTFANFPMKSIQYKNNISPVLKTIIRIAVPTFLVTLTHVVYRSDYSISNILFFDNFHWKQSRFWFIEVLLQTLLLVAIIFSFKKIRAYANHSPYHFGLIMLGITAFIGVLTPYLWAPKELNLAHLPHMKSWLFFFGWCIFYIENKQQKITMALLGVILPVIILGHLSLLTSACTLLLIYLPKVQIPKNIFTNLLHIVIYAVASASLYIYITHMQFKSLLHAIGFDQFILIDIIVGIAGGVLVHYIWHSLIAGTARKTVAKIKNKLKLISNKFRSRAAN